MSKIETGQLKCVRRIKELVVGMAESAEKKEISALCDMAQALMECEAAEIREFDDGTLNVLLRIRYGRGEKP